MAIHYLTVDEIRPSVHFASYHSFSTAREFTYRIPSHHFMLLESGGVEARNAEGRFSAKPGDLLCFRATERNHYRTIGPTMFYQAAIAFAPFPRQRLGLFLDEAGPLPVHIPLGNAFKLMRPVFDTFCLELNREGVVHRLRLRTAVHKMLTIIAEVCAGQRPSDKPIDDWQHARFRLGFELASDVTVKQIARELGVSVDYFINQFKQRFGVTPHVYRTHERMLEAARRLQAEDALIKEVAYGLGFKDQRSFARTFKRHLGVNPSDVQLQQVSDAAGEKFSKAQLFPINTYILPPGTPPEWRLTYRLRRKNRDNRSAKA